MKNSVETFGVFLLGTAVGAALGILFAPDAGEETRNSLVETATNSWDTLKEKAKAGEDELDEYKDKAVDYKNQVVDEAKSKASEYKDKAADAKDDAKSKLKDKADDVNDEIQKS